MKITKDNYNELKSKDLENNYAKVWHVNEIREELLANTGDGGVTSIEGLTGDVVLTNNETTIRVTVDNENNSITIKYVKPYYEIIFEMDSTGSITPIYSDEIFLEVNPTLIYSSNGLTINDDYSIEPSTPFTCTGMSIQLTPINPLTGYFQQVIVTDYDTSTGKFHIKAVRSDRGTFAEGTINAGSAGDIFGAYELKDKVQIAVKIINPALA